jgi:8-amino-7-oxononanoate synthase
MQNQGPNVSGAGLDMNSFEDELDARLAGIRREGLDRQLRRVDSPQGPFLRMNGQSLLNFSSNDYLGLAHDPWLKEVAKRAVETYGVGSGASRLICGSLAPHHVLEENLAAFKGTESALAFSTGYATAIGALSSLLEKDDIVVIDKRVHASVVDAARLSRSKLRVFAHNDLNYLERVLKWADSTHGRTSIHSGTNKRPRIFVVTESVFSMDGDLAPLREIVELKDRYGAWLMVDEAHATGLYGKRRRGLAEAFEVEERIDIQMGTLGKALGCAGGYIAGSQRLIDLLVNRARSFMFSTAPPPATAAAAAEAIRIVQSPEGEKRRTTLWSLVDRLKNILIRAGCPLSPVQSAIVPLITGPEIKAMQLAQAFRERGLYIPAIRYPSVARGQARLRLTITAAHDATHLEALQSALEGLPTDIRAPAVPFT